MEADNSDTGTNLALDTCVRAFGTDGVLRRQSLLELARTLTSTRELAYPPHARTALELFLVCTSAAALGMAADYDPHRALRMLWADPNSLAAVLTDFLTEYTPRLEVNPDVTELPFMQNSLVEKPHGFDQLTCLKMNPLDVGAQVSELPFSEVLAPLLGVTLYHGGGLVGGARNAPAASGNRVSGNTSGLLLQQALVRPVGRTLAETIALSITPAMLDNPDDLPSWLLAADELPDQYGRGGQPVCGPISLFTGRYRTIRLSFSGTVATGVVVTPGQYRDEQADLRHAVFSYSPYCPFAIRKVKSMPDEPVAARPSPRGLADLALCLAAPKKLDGHTIPARPRVLSHMDTCAASPSYPLAAEAVRHSMLRINTTESDAHGTVVHDLGEQTVRMQHAGMVGGLVEVSAYAISTAVVARKHYAKFLGDMAMSGSSRRSRRLDRADTGDRVSAEYRKARPSGLDGPLESQLRDFLMSLTDAADPVERREWWATATVNLVRSCADEVLASAPPAAWHLSCGKGSLTAQMARGRLMASLRSDLGIQSDPQQVVDTEETTTDDTPGVEEISHDDK